jgi:hypothetical protein
MRRSKGSLTIKTADGRKISLVGETKKHALYLAVPGGDAGDGEDTDYIAATPKLLEFLEEAARRVRENIEINKKKR